MPFKFNNSAILGQRNGFACRAVMHFPQLDVLSNHRKHSTLDPPDNLSITTSNLD